MLASRVWPIDRMLVRLGVIPSTEFGPHVTVHDLLKPLPYANDSVACIYAGEVWEHFRYADAERLTRECVRVLAPGGVLRVCVPDGAEFWRRYLEIYGEQMAQPSAQRRAAPLRAHVGMYFHDIATTRQWLGSLGHTHKWQFDEVQLVELLQASGCSGVTRRPFWESRIPDVDQVERSDFLIVEGVKADRTVGPA
jgi:SAM-dependent methyltransferase